MLNKIKHFLLILLGNLLTAIAIAFFIVPSRFITGGVTGVSLALEAFFSLPLSLGISGISIMLLILGFIFLGRDFAISTAVSSIFFPFFVWICEEIALFIGFSTGSITLDLICSSLLFGYGIALIMKQGASSGGLDTIAMILHKKKGISLSLSITVFEILSMLTQLYYSTVNEILGGILITIIYTALLNYYLARGSSKIQVQIYSKKYKEINDIIINEFERGSTLFKIEGGFSGENGYALQTIVSNRELFSLKEAIKKIDSVAFVTVSEISEVSGRGFSVDIQNKRKKKSR